MLYVLLYIDKERRLKFYPEGGCTREVYVSGPGWVVDDEQSDPLYTELAAVKAAETLFSQYIANETPDREASLLDDEAKNNADKAWRPDAE